MPAATEQDKKIQISFFVMESLAQHFKEWAKARSMTQSHFFREVLEYYVINHPLTPPSMAQPVVENAPTGVSYEGPVEFKGLEERVSRLEVVLEAHKREDSLYLKKIRDRISKLEKSFRELSRAADV